MGRYYFQSQQRLFQHNGYSVLIKEWYNPWADSPGRPSTFWVYYVNKEKEMVLHILKGLSIEKIAESDALEKLDVKFMTIEHGHGFFSLPKTIDWAVQEAKNRIR